MSISSVSAAPAAAVQAPRAAPPPPPKVDNDGDQDAKGAVTPSGGKVVDLKA